VIKALHENNVHFLWGSFMVSGLLAWARPELALFIAGTLCIIPGYFLVYAKETFTGKRNRLKLIISPFCTLFGAIPFFINNYIINNNILAPPFLRWSSGLLDEGASLVDSSASNTIPLPQNSIYPLNLIPDFIQTGSNINPSTLLSDLYGILVNPQNGSMGILPLVPVFLIAVFLVPVLVLDHSLKISIRERHTLIILSLLTLGAFLAYFWGIAGMNTSPGVIPDIRYLSPLYLPLTLIGLIIIRKIPAITAQPQKLIRWIAVFWIFFIPLSLIVIAKTFPPVGEEWIVANLLLSYVMSITVYILIALFLMAVIGTYMQKNAAGIVSCLFALICSLPLVWQIDASFVARLYGAGLGGYSFWIPVVLKGFVLIFGSDVTLQNIIW
jgi:hypothetical protein